MLRVTRKTSVRKRLRSRSDRPRLTVFRSLRYIYAQIIDDRAGVTLVSARDKDPQKAGQQLATAAKKAKITRVVFDRGGYKFHGRIRRLAEVCRAEGLEF